MKATTYQKSAEHCRELAKRAESEEERNLLLKLADSWEWLTREGNEETQGNENKPDAAPSPGAPTTPDPVHNS